MSISQDHTLVLHHRTDPLAAERQRAIYTPAPKSLLPATCVAIDAEAEDETESSRTLSISKITLV